MIMNIVRILDAMFMITSAWRDVKPDTIINCFKKAGIAPPSQDEAINDTDDPFAFLANSLEELHSIQVPTDIRAEGFIDFDCDVQVQDSRLLTDNDILQQCRDNGEEEEIVPDNENDVTDLMCDPLPPIKPSNADIASALKTLEQFALFINEDKTSNFLGHIHYLKNVCDTKRIPRVQSTIDNFFK